MAEGLVRPQGRKADHVVRPDEARGYFNPAYITNLFADLRGDRANLSQQIWTIYNLVAWYDYWIERPQQAAAA
jgi:hypothetical protein